MPFTKLMFGKGSHTYMLEVSILSVRMHMELNRGMLNTLYLHVHLKKLSVTDVKFWCRILL